MNFDFFQWISAITAMDTPVLPSGVVMRVWLSLAWSVVLASGVAWLGRVSRWPCRWSNSSRAAATVLAALSCWLPGPYFPAHWLGLAFQSPSISTVWLCALTLWVPRGVPAASRAAYWFAGCMVAFGWLLLLDALALLPVQLYAWGFSAAAIGGAMFVAMLPWACQPKGQGARSLKPWAILAPCSVLVFVALRLPTGNVWDALLDPWLWGALHLFLIHSFYQSTLRKDAHD
jgi:hypothetical protein